MHDLAMQLGRFPTMETLWDLVLFLGVVCSGCRRLAHNDQSVVPGRKEQVVKYVWSLCLGPRRSRLRRSTTVIVAANLT